MLALNLDVAPLKRSMNYINHIFFNTSSGITNAKFICGRAENVIIETTKNLDEESVVGIIDPPRAGCRKLSTILTGLGLYCLHNRAQWRSQGRTRAWTSHAIYYIGYPILLTL